MKRLITSTEKVRKYQDIYSRAYQIYQESFGNISEVWSYVKSEILKGNIPETDGRMLVKDVTQEYLKDVKHPSKKSRFEDLMK